MRWITIRVDRLPERWLLVAQRYGPWLILLIGVGLAWYLDSRQIFIKYNTLFRVAAGDARADTWTYSFGYWLAATVISPTHSVPLVAIVWSLAVLHYRYLFTRFMVNTSRQRKVAYILVLLVLRWGLVVGITAWLGFDRLSGPIANALGMVIIPYAYLVHFQRLRATRQQLIEQKTRAELDALKAQINPHFLFNSLNNIFGTALMENGPRTADSVQQLAHILRYMLEQADTDRASVAAELRFLDNYVMLQKQRLPADMTATVEFNYEWDEEPAQVAPLLLSPLLDYAFRQSIDSRTGKAGFMRANAVVQARELRFKLDYSCATGDAEQADELVNVQQRLRLIYPDRHQFSLHEQETTAQLDVLINLN